MEPDEEYQKLGRRFPSLTVKAQIEVWILCRAEILTDGQLFH
jgi:hypothetical protein